MNVDYLEKERDRDHPLEVIFVSSKVLIFSFHEYSNNLCCLLQRFGFEDMTVLE